MIEDFFQSVLDEHLPTSQLIKHRSVGGGCINNAVQLETDNGTYFIKWNHKSENDLFITEEKGLSILSEKSVLKIAEVLGGGIHQDKAYLLLEWMESGHASSQFWDDFGSGLAELHRCSSDNFGLDHDNFIGRLPQSNTYHQTWSDFFIQERLIPQLKLASSKNLINEGIRSDFELLFPKLENIVPKESPALLHGDLWSGNFLTGEQSEPVLIDPAVHYGHRETELAFTQMFGGFDRKFYQAYQAHFPLEQGFEDRSEIHNLYPLLVHVNLFGSSYLGGVLQTLKRFI